MSGLGAGWVGLGLSMGLEEGQEGVALLASWSLGGWGPRGSGAAIFMYGWIRRSKHCDSLVISHMGASPGGVCMSV
jgi:hypothetical protein